MNLPNSLTIIRIFLIPLLVVELMTRYPNREYIGVGIFLVAAVTDWLDGFLARRRKEVTPLGAWLDPLADKLLIASAFIALVEMRLAPAWIVAIIVGRELAVTGLRNIALLRGFSIEVSDLGKLKMGTQVFTVAALILGVRVPALQFAGRCALWMAVLLAVVSATQYIRKFWAEVGVPVRPRRVRHPLLSLLRPQKSDLRSDVPTHQ